MLEQTILIDDQIDALLDIHQHWLNKSRAEVFRISVALLEAARQAHNRGNKLAEIDQNDRPIAYIDI